MPTRYAVSFTQTAIADLEEIWTFIAEDDVEQATKFILKLERQISSLERFPERCPLIVENELMNTKYRHLVWEDYRTIFRISGRAVFIMRIIHGARLLKNLPLERASAD
jgi:plasmid stabilization system protein ParE